MPTDDTTSEWTVATNHKAGAAFAADLTKSAKVKFSQADEYEMGVFPGHAAALQDMAALGD